MGGRRCRLAGFVAGLAVGCVAAVAPGCARGRSTDAGLGTAPPAARSDPSRRDAVGAATAPARVSVRLIDPRSGAPLEAAREVHICLAWTTASGCAYARWPALPGVRAGDVTLARSEDGTYRLDEVPTGPCRCTVHVRGFLVVQRACVVDGPVDLGTVVLDEGCRLAARAGVGGTVAPGPRTVVAIPSDPGGFGRTAPIGPDGRFELTGLTPGVYRLRLSSGAGGRAADLVAVEPPAVVVADGAASEATIRRWARPAILRLELTSPADVDVATVDGTVLYRRVGCLGESVDVDDLPTGSLRVHVRRPGGVWTRDVLLGAGECATVREGATAGGGA